MGFGVVEMVDWLLLTYKIPREPGSGRVYIWRKLKRLGALLLHDAVWILPETAWTREQFQWLTVEIREMGGEAILLKSNMVLPGEDETLVEQFVTHINQIYAPLLSELEKEGVDLAEIARRYQQVLAQDYFQSPLGQQVRAALLAARGGSEP
jgi:hypothetical protein